MNSTGLLLVDILLLISLLGLASAALASNDARRSVILFIAFGLVVALAWVRLLAPDVALAEAAIGAGLSGALLLAATHIPSRRNLSAGNNTAQQHNAISRSTALNWTVTIFCAVLAFTLIWALIPVFNGVANDTSASAVNANIAESGVSNPVTAVLLNFRAYDTLLELVVLLTAVLGIFALGKERHGYQPAGPVFDGLARWLTTILILTAGYLLWVGAHAPGGAFQAGATLAAAGVVLRLAGQRNIGLPKANLLRAMITGGAGIFLLVGLSMLLLGRSFLQYPPAMAGTLILVIETAAMLSIAATLVLAFHGGRPQTKGDPSC
jgi:multisubunit Na+/H+ antiporter MnhB subunit